MNVVYGLAYCREITEDGSCDLDSDMNSNTHPAKGMTRPYQTRAMLPDHLRLASSLRDGEWTVGRISSTCADASAESEDWSVQTAIDTTASDVASISSLTRNVRKGRHMETFEGAVEHTIAVPRKRLELDHMSAQTTVHRSFVSPVSGVGTNRQGTHINTCLPETTHVSIYEITMETE